MSCLPTDDELKALVSQLTLDEKLLLLAAKNVWETHGIDRLNIPSLKTSDGPNGARGANFFEGTTAACFPACVSLAATFDPNLARRVGAALGQETLTKGANVLLGPTVCMHRSPLGGRNFEAFSEDPLLTGKLAAEYVRGLQSERVAATVKHFVANEQDTRRFSVDQTISERALREIYLRPFEMVVKEAEPWCIMSSYPKVNGAYVDAQPALIRDILRGEWGFDGLVMSDWGAVSNADLSVKYGLDLEMPGPPRYRDQKALRGALDSGSIEEVDVDQRVLAILHLLRRVGKFTDRRETPAEQAINRPDHAELIRKAGADGIVLLKNSGQTLPLRQKPKKMAILGPLARVAAAHGGGSASLNCHYKVTPYDALTERLPGCDISYSKGCHIFRSLPDLREGCVDRDGRPGFKVELYASADLSGEVMWTEESPKGFFTTLMNTNATGALSARLTTVFSPTESGKHYLSFSGVGPSKLFIDGELVLHQEKEIPDSMAYFLGVQDEQRLQYSFEAGRSYEIRVESIPSQVDNSELFLMQGNISAHLGFVMQGEMEADLLAEAVALAKDADVAVFFVGNTAQWETEGQDMASMALPADGSQDRLIAEVAKVNPNTVVVISTGVAVELPWLSDVSAVLQSWYAGQEVGNAIADVLLGVVNPGGKLPVSWPRKYEHTGCYGNFGLDSYDSRKVEYVEGVNVGYRHFDRHYGTDMEVLFPFGYGLSYTQFAVSNIRVSGSINQVNSEVTITATVSNVGGCHGSETIQVYLAPPEDSTADRPPQSLVAFDKVFLEAGQATEVSLVFKEDGAAYWDAEGNEWRVEKGLHQVKVSTSSHSRDVKAQVPLEVKGFSYAA